MNISLIRPYENNAKKHPKKQIREIADSIKAFGFNQPIVVDRHGVIIVGHGRYMASQMIGLKEVPVLQLENITDEQAKAYRLADNKLNESKWDRGLVIQELKDLNLAGFDITLTGFTHDMILTQEERDDAVPTEVPSKAKLGDVYELGDHVLMCGDSTNQDDVARLMGGDLAHCVFTDPPYNVNYKGHGKTTSRGILNDAMGTTEFDIFLDAVFARYAAIVQQGAGVYVFHSTSTQAQFEAALVKNGFQIRNQLIWNKPAAAMGWGDYHWKHEPFFYCSHGEGKAKFYGDRTNSTVWDFHRSEADLVKWAKHMLAAEKRGQTTVWSMKRDPANEYAHPTQKPVEIICFALTNSSQAGDIVVDLFGGSGSTLIAAENAGRKARLMELDPHFVDVIVARWEEYTGLKAKQRKK
jgi:DNA modification methylase